MISYCSPVPLALCEGASCLRRVDSQVESEVGRVDSELDCSPKGFSVTLVNISLVIKRRISSGCRIDPWDIGLLRE
jgi:hypothetical protein